MIMSNRKGLCWKCLHREDCRMFHKTPNAVVTDCGRFIPKNGEQLLMQSVFNNFFSEDKEDGT